MQDPQLKELFDNFNAYLDNEQELREKIRERVRELESHTKQAAIALQAIHSDLKLVPDACKKARTYYDLCKEEYKKIAELIPEGQYYRYNDHWHYNTQRLVFSVAMTIYLETETLVTRETVADVLGLQVDQKKGFHLDIEDYLMGLLNMASELSRFAVNSVTFGDYERPLKISKFVAELNAGFRLLNLKNDGLRKRFDALKYDVKKIEEIVYDVSIRGLKSTEGDEVVETAAAVGAENAA